MCNWGTFTIAAQCVSGARCFACWSDRPHLRAPTITRKRSGPVVSRRLICKAVSSIQRRLISWSSLSRRRLRQTDGIVNPTRDAVAQKIIELAKLGRPPSRSPFGRGNCAARHLFEFRIERPSLRLILRWVWERTVVLEPLAEIAAIEPVAAGRTADEVFDLVLRRIAETFPQIFAALNADHAPAPNHARYRRPEPSSATPQPSCPSVLSRSRCCTALLADDSLPRDLEILAPWTSGAWAASIRSASWQSVCEANGSGSLAHHGRVEPGLVEQRQKDLPAHRDPGAEAGPAELKGHRTGQWFAPLAKSRSSISRRSGTRKR